MSSSFQEDFLSGLRLDPLEDPSRDDKYMLLKQVSVTLKMSVLLVYAVAAVCVLRKVRCSLDRAAYMTICVFLLCEALNLAFYLLELYTFKSDKQVFQIPNVLCQGCLFAVLCYYTFEMKLVLLKL